MKSEIKELRLSLGLTQKEFAEAVGVSLSAVKQWELGYCCPSPSHTKMIAEIKAETASLSNKTEEHVERLKAEVLRKYISLKTRRS